MRYPDPWLLPEGISGALPEEAEHLEQLRRQLLDFYSSWGYELVMPPFIEFLDSLLTGTGADLDLQTFKVTDQISGRMIGIRADMTPQVARIDAHQLRRDTPTRLCYMGTVLHTRPDGFKRTRSPLQVGAELYGHAGIASDREILQLMLETLRITQTPTFHVDLGHVAIYRSLAQQAQLDETQEALLFDAMQRKASSDIQSLLDEWQIETSVADMLRALPQLNGEPSILAQARTALAAADAKVHAALDELEAITQSVNQYPLFVDLAELRGYSYHTGLVFAAYIAGHGQAIAQGGRYDHIGEAFGRARPATGFSVDLRTLVALSEGETKHTPSIFAPAQDDTKLQAAINALRERGERVICALAGQQADAKAMGCERELRLEAGNWVVTKI